MKLRTFFLAVGISTLTFAAVTAGEIALAEHHLSVTLPDSWTRTPEQNPDTLVRAESESGRLRFVLTKPPFKASGNVKDAKFQDGVNNSLRDQGFPKIVRSEIIKVAGSDAYLFEATREDDKPHSILQVVWIQNDVFYSLVFVSLAKPLKEVPDVQRIIESVKLLPEK